MSVVNLSTINFKTRSEIREISMPRVVGNNQHKHNYIIALDGGYSGVKGMSEDLQFCFPSYAKKVSKIDVIGCSNPTDIVLIDHKKAETWLIGAFAQNTMDVHDIQGTTDENLYTRYRYQSDIFKAIMTAGLGLGLFRLDTDKLDGITICLQTGLPSAYVASDAGILKTVLSGDYDFSLRVGDETRPFNFSIRQENVGVMEQPRGTLANIVYDKNGHLLEDMRRVLNSDTLIDDIGFGTEDIFSLRSGANIRDNKNKTYSDTAMRSVFENVVNTINSDKGTAFKVFELEKYLKRGEIPVFIRQEMRTEEIPFGDLLEDYNRKLCEKSVKRLMEEYNNLLDYQYLIISGGTGESRYEIIRDMLKGLQHLTVLPGNAADRSISSIYANVRGYYMSMLLKVQKLVRTAATA